MYFDVVFFEKLFGGVGGGWFFGVEDLNLGVGYVCMLIKKLFYGGVKIGCFRDWVLFCWGFFWWFIKLCWVFLGVFLDILVGFWVIRDVIGGRIWCFVVDIFFEG